MIIWAGHSPFLYDFLFGFFLFFMHAALDGLLLRTQWGGGGVAVEPQEGLRPHRKEEEMEGFNQQVEGCEWRGRTFAVC